MNLTSPILAARGWSGTLVEGSSDSHQQPRGGERSMGLTLQDLLHRWKASLIRHHATRSGQPIVQVRQRRPWRIQTSPGCWCSRPRTLTSLALILLSPAAKREDQEIRRIRGYKSSFCQGLEQLVELVGSFRFQFCARRPHFNFILGLPSASPEEFRNRLRRAGRWR